MSESEEIENSDEREGISIKNLKHGDGDVEAETQARGTGHWETEILSMDLTGDHPSLVMTAIGTLAGVPNSPIATMCAVYVLVASGLARLAIVR